MNVTIDCVIYGLTPDTTTRIFRNENTIGYIFVNTGNTPVQLNNYVLQPQAVYKTFENNLLDKTEWKIQFLKTNAVYSSCASVNAELTALIYNVK